MFGLLLLTVSWGGANELSPIKLRKCEYCVLNETSLLFRIRVFREIVHFLFYLGKVKNAHNDILPTSSGIFKHKYLSQYIANSYKNITFDNMRNC